MGNYINAYGRYENASLDTLCQLRLRDWLAARIAAKDTLRFHVNARNTDDSGVVLDSEGLPAWCGDSSRRP